jgi:mitochondrial fission protein ELM1
MRAPPTSWILTADYAGLLSQARGLAEAAGLAAEERVLRPRAPWRWASAKLWPAPLAAVPPDTLRPPVPDLLIGCGGMGAVVSAALKARHPGTRAVQIQHPGINPARFDLILANRHDGLHGPNVMQTRLALHRVTPARLAEAARHWAPRFADLPRPLVAVLVGGVNVRFRLDAAVATGIANGLARMMEQDRAGVMLTPSRRTAPEVLQVFRDTLGARGAFVWDGTGENPYFGMLALADVIVVTQDSVSMLSEAVATEAPVLMATLPGHSRRQSQLTDWLQAEGRVRTFAGRLEQWPVRAMNETLDAAAEMRIRLGI